MVGLEDLLEVSVPPSDKKSTWFTEAETAVDYVARNARENEIVLYTNVGQTYINAVLLPLASVTPPDTHALKHAHFDPTNQWRLEHVSGGGQPDRMYLSSPCDDFGIKGSENGQQLVFRRQFADVDKGEMRTEISQQLIHALEIYWLDEENAYCRLNEEGDIEPVIRQLCLEKQANQPGAILVTILAKDLHRYMAVTECAFVTKFDFTRFISGSFSGWQDTKRDNLEATDLFYDFGVQPGASFANGILITRPLVTKDDLIAKANDEWSGKNKEYASFKAHDWKNNRLIETSCAPTSLSSYFEEGSSLPFQTTPAFFKGEVLQRYKADPEKFQLENRSIHSRAGWYLKAYDVNDAGQVHAYLCDLAMLPYNEQLYWKSFNEWPKAPISTRSFQTDFQGSFSSIPDPLEELKHEVQKLDSIRPDWWKPRGKAAANSLHYPTSTSPDEWSNAILALDQFVVEGFVTKALRKKIDEAGGSYEKQWQSIRLLQQVLVLSSLNETEASDLIEPLKRTHALRSKTKGHLAPTEKSETVKELRKEHGSLSSHFRSLVEDVLRAFDRVVELL